MTVCAPQQVLTVGGQDPFGQIPIIGFLFGSSEQKIAGIIKKFQLLHPDADEATIDEKWRVTYTRVRGFEECPFHGCDIISYNRFQITNLQSERTLNVAESQLHVFIKDH